jgi:hypothetical protein
VVVDFPLRHTLMPLPSPAALVHEGVELLARFGWYALSLAVLVYLSRPYVEAHLARRRAARSLAEATAPERVAVLREEMLRVREEQARAHVLAGEEAARKAKEAEARRAEAAAQSIAGEFAFGGGGAGRPSGFGAGGSGGSQGGARRWGADRMRPRGGGG